MKVNGSNRKREKNNEEKDHNGERENEIERNRQKHTENEAAEWSRMNDEKWLNVEPLNDRDADELKFFEAEINFSTN